MITSSYQGKAIETIKGEQIKTLRDIVSLRHNDEKVKEILESMREEIEITQSSVNKLITSYKRLEAGMPRALIIVSHLAARFHHIQSDLKEIGRMWKKGPS